MIRRGQHNVLYLHVANVVNIADDMWPAALTE
jgi:hypothetical protein